MSNDSIRANQWSRLQFYDPEPVLRALRELELALAPIPMDERLRSLRTGRLKGKREARDAAIFAHGLGEAVMGTKVYLAPAEGADYDFVTLWRDEDTQHFCPVQLKELVPERVNAKATLQAVLEGLRKYVSSPELAVAVKLNRMGRIDFDELQIPELRIGQLWFFGGTKPDQSEWFLYGNALDSPHLFAFTYPD